jgi:hypothetical protein
MTGGAQRSRFPAGTDTRGRVTPYLECGVAKLQAHFRSAPYMPGPVRAHLEAELRGRATWYERIVAKRSRGSRATVG